MSQVIADDPADRHGLAESLSGIWCALHADTSFTLSDGEIHYLTATALALDDDLVSHLLLKKIRLATVRNAAAAAATAVTMSSHFEYRFDGRGTRFGQLVPPTSLNRSYGLSIGSLEGAGVLEMRAGQSILWPNRFGRLGPA